MSRGDRLRVPGRERGAALLAVLLLVAVTGALAAAAMEKLRLSQALALNGLAMDQARLHARGIETLALVAIEDMIARDPNKTSLAGNWLGQPRTVPLPGGGVAEGRLFDGGNCFNLNSLVQGDGEQSATRRSGVDQFVGLMTAIGIAQGEARRIAESAADWADSDTVPNPGGAEDSYYASGERPFRPANTLYADVSELRAVAGVSDEQYRRIAPWLCALPLAELSLLNINTLLPEQAPLLAMLAPGQIGVERARQLIAARPEGGWATPIDFFRTPTVRDLNLPLDVQMQPQVRTRWFRLDVTVEMEGAELRQSTLVDARLQPARVAQRSWGG
jgi:general secretion pathway protein K